MESLFSKLIWQQDDVLDENFCKSIIDKFESDSEVCAGQTIGGINLDIKKTTDLWISCYKNWKDEDQILFNILNKKMEEYCNYLQKINVELYPFTNSLSHEIEDTGYNIQKYEIKKDTDSPAGYYNWHADSKIEKGRSRVITYLWYLNTVDEGGETEFIDGTLVNPKVGKLIMFPSNWEYVHRGNAPISNSKYICTGWFYMKLI